MKQTIPFVKDIEFANKISEITSIALEHSLKMENNDSIIGTFIVSGKYKMNISSEIENDFEEKLDIDITLDDKYDDTKLKIDIDNFYYEIIDEVTLRVHIDVLIDNLVYLKKKERCVEEENVSMDSNITQESKNIISDEVKEDIKNDVINDTTYIENISNNFLSGEEKYVSYKVHIIRNDENIEMIKEKYNVSNDELEKYNNLNNITLGSKLIIPISND